MKRKNNLYPEIYKFDNIVSAYDEVCRNTKNKRKVLTLKEYKTIYISRIHDILKDKLNIKYYVRYQDDFLLFHPSKDYLKYCLNEISKFLLKEKLFLNNKTRIYNSSDNFVFLGRNCLGNHSKYRSVKRKIKNKFALYNKNKITLKNLTSTIICYKSHYPNMFKDTKCLF